MRNFLSNVVYLLRCSCYAVQRKISDEMKHFSDPNSFKRSPLVTGTLVYVSGNVYGHETPEIRPITDPERALIKRNSVGLVVAAKYSWDSVEWVPVVRLMVYDGRMLWVPISYVTVIRDDPCR